MPPRPFDLQMVGRLTAGDSRLGLQALDVDPSVIGVNVHVIGGLGAVDRHAVDRAVTGAQVDVGPADISSRHVVDRDRVGTAERVQVQFLDTVDVHPHISRLTQEQRAGGRWPKGSSARRPRHR